MRFQLAAIIGLVVAAQLHAQGQLSQGYQPLGRLIDVGGRKLHLPLTTRTQVNKSRSFTIPPRRVSREATLGKTWRLKKKGGERVGTGELLRCGVQVDLLAQPWVAPPRVDLYSNSTVALGVEIGRLARYYQYLPGGDWDLDHTHERVVAHAHRSRSHGGEWINSKIPRGQADSQNNGSREMAPQWA